jgi:hypothetical protein
MTKISKENMRICDYIELVTVDSGPKQMVKVWKDGHAAFISGKEGPVIYLTRAAAMFSCSRIRPDLVPRQFEEPTVAVQMEAN